MSAYNPNLQRIIRRRKKPLPLYVQAKIEIIRLIKKGAFPEGKLPPETVLSELLGISRTSIREALMALGRDGIISKKQGIGNLIHFSALNTKMRIDQIKDFVQLLEDGGYAVSMEKIQSEWVSDFSDIKINVPFNKDSEFLLSKIIYKADKHPAIMSITMIPRSVMIDPEGRSLDTVSEEKKTARSLGDYLNSHTCEEVSHSISVYTPVKADSETAGLFGIKKGDPMIEWDETYYGIRDTRLCFNRILFHPDKVKLTSLCKWN